MPIFWTDDTSQTIDVNESVDSGYEIDGRWTNLTSGNMGKIYPGGPIQFEVWNNNITDFWSFEMFFSAPAIIPDEEISGDSSIPILQWQLSSDSDVLIWDPIMAHMIWEYDSSASSYICTPSPNNCDIVFDDTMLGIDKFWMADNFEDFYGTHCANVSSDCSLKIFVVGELITPSNSRMPYLEWTWSVWWGDTIPLPYTQVEAQWKSYWYSKNISIGVPQDTVLETFDFAVFQ